MAREKTWTTVQNVNVTGADDAATAQNWMWNFFQFLSGGAGSATAAWEIVSASNASSVGGHGTITGPSSFTWNGSGAHSWFVFKKDMLPTTGSTERYIYLTVDLNQANDGNAHWVFDYETPNFSGQNTSTRPAETSRAYENTVPFRYEYSASAPTYFHGCIDTTGSFHVFTTQDAGVSNPPNPYAISCARLETPRAGEVDPFPIFLKLSYGANVSSHGAWTMGDGGGTTYNNITANTSYSNWNGATTNTKGGCAMWYYTGTQYADGGDSGWWTPSGNGLTVNPWLDTAATGDPHDGSYPLIAMYMGMNFGNTQTNIRGRLPDVFCVQGSGLLDGSTGAGYGVGGLSVPQTGDIEYSCIGDFFFPFSASIEPGA